MKELLSKSLNSEKFLIVIFLFFLTAWNFSAINSFFSQDDFFHLSLIMGKKFFDIPSFFVSWLNGQTFYRPLSREVFNLLMFRQFGLNPLPFHLVNLLIISANAILVYKLSHFFTNKRSAAFISVLIYLLSPIHSIELYYLASVQTLFATFFMAFSTISFLSYLKEKKIRSYLLSLILFVLGIFSHESSVVLPLILTAMFLLKPNKLPIKNKLLLLLPFFIFGLGRFLLLLIFKNLPHQNVYQPVTNPKTALNTLAWYVLWSFGLPEILVDFIGPGFRIN